MSGSGICLSIFVARISYYHSGRVSHLCKITGKTLENTRQISMSRGFGIALADGLWDWGRRAVILLNYTLAYWLTTEERHGKLCRWYVGFEGDVCWVFGSCFPMWEKHVVEEKRWRKNTPNYCIFTLDMAPAVFAEMLVRSQNYKQLMPRAKVVF